MNKTHLAVLSIGTNVTTACGRKGRTSDEARRVTCLVCQSKPAFAEVKFNEDQARQAAFLAQTPRQMQEPWYEHGTIMVCRECGTDQFRMGDRTTMGHYQSYVCVNGHTESRLTETGMSF